MVDRVRECLVGDPGGFYVDATVGTGGHALALLEGFPALRLLALDWDPRALETARARLSPYADRVRLLQLSFGDLPGHLAAEGLRVAGVLLDLGLSSLALEDPRRGFSHRYPEAPLDMRFDPSRGEPLARRLQRWSEQEIRRILRELGEVRGANALARALVSWRRERPLRTVGDLLEAIRQGLRRPPSQRLLAQIFQAFRLAVTGELQALRQCLLGLPPHVVPGGRVVVLTYQSLEAQVVKECLRDPRGPEGQPLWKPLFRKSLAPSAEEVARNPRARSARLRAFVRADGTKEGRTGCRDAGEPGTEGPDRGPGRWC
jgi:16S rRNA (cytosine1402-N4)-methyltransferase